MVSSTKHSSNAAAKAIVAVVAAAVVAVGLFAGYSIASASGNAAGDTFGVSGATVALSSSDGDEAAVEQSAAATEDSVLTATASRDISQGVADIDARHEAERIAAEEAARQEEQQRIAAAQAAREEQAATVGAPDLTEVDWSVGKDAFIAEWTARIDAYLQGSPLAGYGVVFATAAWDNGVDPRWSPAISNTESSKGAVCFLPYNAWGWGSSGFSSWEEAIQTHVAGLAAGYGYTISYAGAQKYCPPNYHNWYVNTLAEMQRI